MKRGEEKTKSMPHAPVIPAFSFPCPKFFLPNPTFAFLAQSFSFLIQHYSFLAQSFSFQVQPYSFLSQSFFFQSSIFSFLGQPFSFLAQSFSFLIQLFPFLAQSFSYRVQPFYFLAQSFSFLHQPFPFLAQSVSFLIGHFSSKFQTNFLMDLHNFFILGHAYSFHGITFFILSLPVVENFPFQLPNPPFFNLSFQPISFPVPNCLILLSHRPGCFVPSPPHLSVNTRIR